MSPGHPPIGGIEAALVDLGARLDYPVPRDLPAAVMARLRAEETPAPRTAAVTRPAPWVPRPSRRRLALVIALALVVLGGAAIAVRLAVGGIELRPAPTPSATSTPTSPSPTAGPVELGLGEPAPLAEAVAAVPFQVRAPVVDRLGPPDRAFLNTSVPGGMVALVWDPGPGLPEIGESGAGLVLTQFGGRVEGVKEFDPVRPPRLVAVEGRQGYWVRRPHRLIFMGTDREGHDVLARVVGSTLIWEAPGGVVTRLESSLRLADVLEIAGTLEPLEA